MFSKKEWPYNFVEDLCYDDGFLDICDDDTADTCDDETADTCSAENVVKAIYSVVNNELWMTAVEHVYRDGHTLKKTAEVLFVSSQTIHSRLERARHRVRRFRRRFFAIATTGKDPMDAFRTEEKYTTVVKPSLTVRDFTSDFCGNKYIIMDVLSGKVKNITGANINIENQDLIANACGYVLCEVLGSNATLVANEGSPTKLKFKTMVNLRVVFDIGKEARVASSLFKWFNGYDLFDCCPGIIDNILWFLRIQDFGEQHIPDFDYNNDAHKTQFLSLLPQEQMLDVLLYGKDYTRQPYAVVHDGHSNPFGANVRYADGVVVFRSRNWFTPATADLMRGVILDGAYSHAKFG